MEQNEFDSELFKAFDIALYFNKELQLFYKISDGYFQRDTVFMINGNNNKAKKI